jgi:hypothetical protein
MNRYLETSKWMAVDAAIRRPSRFGIVATHVSTTSSERVWVIVEWNKHQLRYQLKHSS